MRIPHSASLLAALFLLIAGCEPSYTPLCKGDDDGLERPSHWTVESHCKGVDANYDELFGDERVHVFRIEVSAEDHEATMDELDEMLSGGGSPTDLDALDNPMWVPASVTYDGQLWTQVGMRYKGHSSLKAAWQNGGRKLSFKLDFDKYEDDYPKLKNQRFFGFNRFSFSNAFNDPSFLREKVAAEVFRAAGVPAARSSFAAVYLSWGEEEEYLGLYTVVEDPCDEMRETQLGDNDGALFKPWGEPARWLPLSEVGEDELAEYFDSCEDDPDLTGLVGALAVLHGGGTDAASWRAGLEAVFDVSAFLRFLAVNQAIMNWDSYGCMNHNYYVYENPEDGRLVWFPWDLNEAMLDREQTGCPEPGSVLLDEIVYPENNDPEDEIDSDWPLIQLLLADEVYRAEYIANLRATMEGPFEESATIARLRTLHELVAPWVVGPEAEEAYPYTNTNHDAFESSLVGGANALETHVTTRHEAVAAALED